MRYFFDNGDSGADVRDSLSAMACAAPAEWDAYQDFRVLADGTDISGAGGQADMCNNPFTAANLPFFQVTDGIAWMGGRSNLATGTTYMALKPGPIRLLWCEFVLDRYDATVTNADSASLALCITNDEAVADLDNLLHPIITRLGWLLQIRTEGGTLNTIASGTWVDPLAADGTTRHQFAMLVHGNRVRLLLPTTDTLGRTSYTAASDIISRCAGSLAYWQENRTDATKAKPGICRIGLITRPGASHVQYLTATGNLSARHNVHLVRPAASGVVVTLPTANLSTGADKTISVPSTAAYSISVSGAFWDGSSSKTLAAGERLRAVADPANNVWAVV